MPKAILRFSIPTILSQLITLLYNLADTFFVGHTNDPNQVAALTLSFPLFMSLTLIGNLTGIGANSLISRSLGQKDPHKARIAGTFGLYGGVMIWGIWAIILGFFMKPILTAIGASSATYNFTASYLKWTVIYGGFPSIVSLLMGHITRGEGNTREASLGITIGAVLNIALDPIFVLVLHMGITGAAIATALSNCVSMIYFIIYYIRKRNTTIVSWNPAYLKEAGKVMKDVLLVGMPAALVVMCGILGNVILTHFMAPYGDVKVAAFGIVQKMSTVTMQINVGITQGVMPLIGYNYAAGQSSRAKAFCRYSFLILGIFVACWVTMTELIPGTLVHAFINDAATIETGIRFMRVFILCVPGMCGVNMFNSIFQAMGKWKRATWITVIRQLGLAIPIMLLLNYLIGVYGLVLAQPTADTISLVIAFIMYKKMSFDVKAQ